MQGLRFNHVFAALLALCALSAFVLPRFVDPARAQVQNIFAPISKPTAGIAQWIHARIWREPTPDRASPERPRPDSNIRDENAELRQMLARLSAQLEILQKREADHAKLGELRDICTPFTVSAGDAGTGESLVISGTSLDGLRVKQAVVFPGGVAGQLLTPGVGGTRVRLITDKGFALTGVFVRYVTNPAGKMALIHVFNDPPLVTLVRGDGNNTLLIDGLSMEKAKDIRVNDVVLLADTNDWPSALQGQPIGRVVAAPSPSRSAPLIAEIHLEPFADLMHLSELMVVTKTKQ